MDWNNMNDVKGYLSDLQRRREAGLAKGYGVGHIDKEYQRVYGKYSPQFNQQTTIASANKGYNKPSPYRVSTFTPPNVSALSYQDALKQAQARLNPMRDEARTNAGVINQQQQNLLRQQLNARGQLSGGAANQGALDTSASLQAALAKIDAGYNTDTANMADALVQRSQELKRQEIMDAYQQWLSQNQLAMQAEGMNREADAEAWQRAYQEGRASRSDLESDRGYDLERQKFLNALKQYEEGKAWEQGGFSSAFDMQKALEDYQTNLEAKKMMQQLSNSKSLAAYEASLRPKPEPKAPTATERKNADMAEDYSYLKSLSVVEATKQMNDNWSALIQKYGTSGAKELWNQVMADAIQKEQAEPK